MITTEQAQKILKQHQRTAPTADFFAHLPNAYQLLARIIVRWQVKGEKPRSDRELYLEAFDGATGFNPWLSPEGQALATILYGAPKAHLVAAVWDLTLGLPYTTGYSRRPFRRRPDANPLTRRLDRMRVLFQVGMIGFSGLDVFETARYSGYWQWQAPQLALWYTAALNAPATADRLRTLIADILAGEEEVGLVNRGLIMGLLTTEDPQNWTLVEQLLLAAQREEGLRQTILESLDETSTGALYHFLGVILEHDLSRFSAVVRAVDTWFGFGWEAPRQSTIKRVLTLAKGLLAEPELATEALADKDSLVSYVALWSVAVTNVDDALMLAADYLDGEDRTKKLLGQYFIAQTEFSNVKVSTYLYDHLGDDLELDYWLLNNAPAGTEIAPLFDRLIHAADTLPKAGRSFEGTVFSWLTTTVKPEFYYNFLIHRGDKDILRRLCTDIGKVPATSREQLLRRVFPDQYSYSLRYGKALKAEKAAAAAGEEWQRDLIRQAAVDRNGAVMATGLRFLGALELENEDRRLIVDLLRRKGKELRAELIRVILGQEEGTLKVLVNELLLAKSVDQRLAGLEIMTILYEQNRLTTYVLAQHRLYREREKFSKNEEVLLAKFDAPPEEEISFVNGFRTINYAKLTPLMEPQPRFDGTEKEGLTARMKSAALSIVQGTTGTRTKFRLPGLVNGKKLRAAVTDLIRLTREHGKMEYECWYNKGYADLVLLENMIGLTSSKAFELSARKQLDYLPLPNVWKAWYERAELNDFELLFAITQLDQGNRNNLGGPFLAFFDEYLPDLPLPDLPGTIREQQHTRRYLANLMRMFYLAFHDERMILKFRIDILEDMIARLPEKLRQPLTYKTQWGYDDTVFWADRIGEVVPGGRPSVAFRSMDKHDPADLKRLWDLEVYLMAQTLVRTKQVSNVLDMTKKAPQANVRARHPDIWLTIYLHQLGLITDEDLLFQSLHLKQLFQLLNGNRSMLARKKMEDVLLPESLMKPLREKLLDLELQRGDLATDATPYVNQLTVVEGAAELFRTLERMGKEPFHRGYAWGRETSKQVSFSGIVRKSIAIPTDTSPAFSALVKSAGLPPRRLLEVAMYAPQWAPWVAEHLKIEDLEIAVWWFHAHASDYMSGQKEKIVAQFSPIDKQDFIQGAIDVDWFYAAYNGVGKRTWKQLHDAAKYISDGNGHRQVKTYSAVMLGEVKITETLKKIKENRDKVYVKALGLIPFSRTNPEGDVLRRYKLLQAFNRESRQFGAQRQESEQNAARIGLDNLARNAGHDDVTRFGWIMEAEATRQIMEQSLVAIEEVTVQLIIDENGLADILVAKSGKRQKTIPAKLKKDKTIARLKEHKAELRRQFSRTRQSLENAMLAGVTFTAEDLAGINQHPIVRPMLGKLVLYAQDRKLTGFWRDGQLVDATGEPQALRADDALVIAHPAQLYELVEWDRYQRYAFDNELVQPFKQIFRELYLPTKDELERALDSQRYQGHQIQPQKAAALLRTRGWTISDTEGLQKVYHKHDLVATMYAVADWYSPADVEAPVIESVAFRNRRGQTIRIGELPAVLFSEVMRDVDLVVSVAHVGGVDPEASHSTLQMRAALARESARLFKATNVEVKARHLVINGKHGSYNIHLGSGMVSKGGLQLNIIAVHGQHRGRLFLPFLDDDPKSAEIISKMKLLAEDDRIKDPTVLGQLLG